MQNKCRLSPVALGLALGVFWGVVIAAIGLLALYTTHGKILIANMSLFFHLGSSATVGGVLLAGFMAFIDALVMGIIIAGLYNLFCCCCPKSKIANACCSASCKCECPCCKKNPTIVEKENI